MTLTRKTPMRRSGFKPKAKAKAVSPIGSPFNPDRATFERQQGIKRRAKKPTVAEGSKYLAACRGERCYLRIFGVCPWLDPDETCVPAHRNEGKGIGLKVENSLTCPACFWCHTEYDQGKRFTREEKREIWNRGYLEWEPVRARKMGIEVEQQELEAA